MLSFGQGQPGLDELAAAVADGRPLDWDGIESSAGSDDERETIRRLRAIASIGRAHAELTFSDTASDSLSVRSQLPGFDDPSVPTHWGPLRILERVGRGRFGDVYRAWDASLDREVALKLLRRRDVDSQNADREVIEEGRLMARVRHPNVVTIHGAQRVDGRTGLWMEYVEGRTLAAELAERGPFPAEEIAQVGLEVCRALEAVHEAGLVHRDVKAQNVLRDRGGRVVLGDFGTGHELADPQPGSQGLAGTPAYIAPEVLRGESATCQSDIYSLGVLLFHMATGAYPVNGRTIREIRSSHERRDRALLAALRPDLNEQLVSTIERALNPERSLRFGSAVEFHGAIDICRRRPDSRGRRRTLIAIGTALTFTFAIVALGYWGVRPSSQSETPLAPSIPPSAAPAVTQEVRTDAAPPGNPSSVVTETASSPKLLAPTLRSEANRPSPVLALGTLLDHAAAADAFLRDGEIEKARRQAAMIPESDTKGVVGSEWRLGFEARASWQELHATASLKATDAIRARRGGPFAAAMYVSLGRLKQAEGVAAELPRAAEGMPPNPFTRDRVMASIVRLTADPAPLRYLLLAQPPSTIALNDRPELLIHAGLLDEAESALQSLQKAMIGNKVMLDITRIAEAEITLKRGNPSHAIELLQGVAPLPFAMFPTPNAYLARVRALAWEALGDLTRAIEALKSADVTRHVVSGSSNAGIWLEHRGHMARLYRLAGQHNEARVIEDELRTLLAVADADHPVLRGLQSQQPRSH